MTSVCIVGYSFGISVTLPFFSTLVGLVTSVTYLTCAYTIPAWFTLRLLGERVSRAEYWLLWAIIPVSLAFSALGFGSSGENSQGIRFSTLPKQGLRCVICL